MVNCLGSLWSGTPSMWNTPRNVPFTGGTAVFQHRQGRWIPLKGLPDKARTIGLRRLDVSVGEVARTGAAKAQLYQAIAEGPVLLAFLLAGLKLKMRPGGLGCVFLIGYGLLRCLTENFREVDPGYLGYWHGLTNGQLLSLGMIPLGILYLAIASWFHRPAARAFGSRP